MTTVADEGSGDTACNDGGKSSEKLGSTARNEVTEPKVGWWRR